MNKIAAVNYYHYTRDGLHYIELEMINYKNGVTTWKRYSNKSKQKVYAIAKTQETKFYNRLNKIYGGKNNG